MKRTTRNLVAGVVAVVVALAVVAAVVRLSERGEVQVRLGDDEFDVGGTEGLARRAPVIFQDLLDDGSRDLVIFHAPGQDPGFGWVAVEVTRGEGCGVEQDRETLAVTDGCTGEEVTIDSTDRTRYATRVDDGRLLVDLTPGGAPGRPDPTTTLPTTSTTAAAR